MASACSRRSTPFSVLPTVQRLRLCTPAWPAGLFLLSALLLRVPVQVLRRNTHLSGKPCSVQIFSPISAVLSCLWFCPQLGWTRRKVLDPYSWAISEEAGTSTSRCCCFLPDGMVNRWGFICLSGKGHRGPEMDVTTGRLAPHRFQSLHE